MEVVPIEGLDAEWDRLVWESPAGTIFHTLRFLGYHPASRYEFTNLAISQEGRLVCVIPGGFADADGRLYYRSPVGASFGGPVFAGDLGLRGELEALEALERFLRQSGCAGADMVLPPSCYSLSGGFDLGFAMLASNYRLVSREATAVVPLETLHTGGLAPSLRRNIRKADASGLEVEPGGDVDGFFDVLEAGLAAKGAAPTHTAPELKHLMGLFPDRMVLFEGRIEKRMVGGCLCFICNDRTALTFYICDDPESRQHRVVEGVLYNCIMWLKEHGYAYLDLGTISIDGRVNWGLARFKAKFTARIQVRERYVLEFEEGT